MIFPDQFIKVVAGSFFSAFVIHDKPLDDILAQALCRPDAELRAAMGFDAVANRDDDVEVIEINVACNLRFSFGLNYPEFPDSWGFFEFALLIDVLDMLIDRANILLKQI